MGNLKRQCDVSSGREKADIVLKNGTIINVFTEELITGDVAIVGDTIVGIGDYKGNVEIDCSNKYISPGFIDAHMHIESTMVMPIELSKKLLKSGTTTIIADPHELVNVKGASAIDFLLESTKDIPLNVYIMVPSSVPATSFETNGVGKFSAKDMESYVNNPRILGLGEVMCFNDVINSENEILDKLELFKNKVVDGHAPNINAKSLQTYVCAGIENDHECITFDEVYEKLRAGLKILIREGSAAKNLKSIVSGMLKHNLPIEEFMFCTDDKHLDDIEKQGHIRWNIKCAIDLGMEPVRAIKVATYNSAKAYGLRKIGAIGAGYKADIVVLNDLDKMEVDSVYKDGNLVNEEMFSNYNYEIKDKELLNTVKFKYINKEKIQLKVSEKNYVMEIVPYQILTNKLYESLPCADGYFVPNKEYSKLCVVERHRMTGNVAIAPLKGFGIKNGAIATTVAHDSHNIIVAGDNDDDILVAINYLKEIQGGYVIVSNGKVLAHLSLQVAGLISTFTAEEVQEITDNMLEIARKMGVPEYVDPFITLSFMALPVVPQIRLTDLGLFDVEEFKFI
ncbi:adenine deaminase [Clostridioides difficile]|uniref:adenine deaminase n=1 Tax=Clostridioides difficile TaxID=1496 RepID=UPI000F614B3C|nr:adenine deaminase [Clostridioides difficile]MCJ0308309.1 adenine deaminase [Clostridioides difficile]MCJ0376289.1 adenine deaminase [Clostridioides difficile]MCJ0408983.1 adenine deaminase [Clostridioides difficile]MCO8700963.1 adenine deaminase [Clostridioides difficile]RRH26960.1 adenine deaminase [Clostridioides difficile]